MSKSYIIGIVFFVYSPTDLYFYTHYIFSRLLSQFLRLLVKFLSNDLFTSIRSIRIA